MSFALLAIAGICWGTGGLAGLLLAEQAGLAAVPIATHRLLAGGLLLLALAGLAGEQVRIRFSRTVLIRTATAGFLLAVFRAAYFASAQFTSVGLTTLTVMVAVTVLVTFGGAFLEGRRVPVSGIVSSLVAVLGLGLLLNVRADGYRPLGTVLALISAAGFALLTLDRRDLPSGLGRVGFTGFGFLVGGLLLLPAGLVAGMAVPTHPQALATLLYLGLVPTALAYAAYFAALPTAGSAAAVVAVLLEPVTATALAALLLDERLSPVQGCGAALVLIAILLQALASGDRTVTG